MKSWTTERAPKLGGLIEFYLSPDRVRWSPTGINVPDYPKLAQIWWQQIGNVNSGAATAQEAMDALAQEMDDTMARMQAADEASGVYGGCGPRLNPAVDPAEWIGKPDGPKAKLENEKPQGVTVDYMIGTMIELPRAALQAGAIAEDAEFFSFGTNDLTQTTLGVSRDDAGHFLGHYVEKGIFARDPFVTLDVEGVGELVTIAAERGRSARPGLKLGICGEHGGDPASIAFCEQAALDYVSASPYRVPIARLAAAQAALRKG